MKVFKLEVMVLDMEDVGELGIKEILESTRYPNRCISPEVKSVEVRDVGKWHDDHPLNKIATAHAEYIRLFSAPEGAAP